MLSNSDTERQIPGAVMDIPHGNKNTERIDTENRWVVARFGDGGARGKVVKGTCLSDKMRKSWNVFCSMETKANPAGWGTGPPAI